MPNIFAKLQHVNKYTLYYTSRRNEFIIPKKEDPFLQLNKLNVINSMISYDFLSSKFYRARAFDKVFFLIQTKTH